MFRDDAADVVHDADRRLPRAVNNIATQALVAAMAARKNIVDEQSARTAVNETRSTDHHHATPNTKAPAADVGGALLTPAHAHHG